MLLAAVDATYKFVYIDIGCNGRISDGGVFSRSKLSTALERNTLQIPPPSPLKNRVKKTPFVIVADDAFPLKTYLMKPYPYRAQPGVVKVFNYRLSRARRIVENVFGLMANVFRVFRKPILLSPEKTEVIVLASCTLHNYLMTKKESRKTYAPSNSFDREDIENGTIQNGTWRGMGMPATNMLPIEKNCSNNSADSAKATREEFRDYFMTSDGEVSWQYKYL